MLKLACVPKEQGEQEYVVSYVFHYLKIYRYHLENENILKRLLYLCTST